MATGLDLLYAYRSFLASVCIREGNSKSRRSKDEARTEHAERPRARVAHQPRQRSGAAGTGRPRSGRSRDLGAKDGGNKFAKALPHSSLRFARDAVCNCCGDVTIRCQHKTRGGEMRAAGREERQRRSDSASYATTTGLLTPSCTKCRSMTKSSRHGAREKNESEDGRHAVANVITGYKASGGCSRAASSHSLNISSFPRRPPDATRPLPHRHTFLLSTRRTTRRASDTL